MYSLDINTDVSGNLTWQITVKNVFVIESFVLEICLNAN